MIQNITAIEHILIIYTVQYLIHFPSRYLVENLYISNKYVIFVVLNVLLLAKITNKLYILSIAREQALRSIFRDFRIIFGEKARKS